MNLRESTKQQTLESYIKRKNYGNKVSKNNRRESIDNQADNQTQTDNQNQVNHISTTPQKVTATNTISIATPTQQFTQIRNYTFHLPEQLLRNISLENSFNTRLLNTQTALNHFQNINRELISEIENFNPFELSLSENNNQLAIMPNDTTPKTSLKELLKMPAAELILPKDLNDMQYTIDLWETAMEGLNAEDQAKLILLKQAISKHKLKAINTLNRKEATYEELKKTLIQETKQPEYKLINSPLKKEPRKAFEVLTTMAPDTQLEDLIDQLHAHVDAKTLNDMHMRCSTRDDLKIYVEKLEQKQRKKEIAKCKKDKTYVTSFTYV